MNERDIFIAALQIEGSAERQSYLTGACADQPGLRDQVEALLRLYENAGSFLESPQDAKLTESLTGQETLKQLGTSIGPYKLLQQIGEGGMGTVYMAQQTEPVRRIVAIKIIKAGMDSKQVIARFEAERQALALMDHPNIAKVLDAGTTGYLAPALAGGEGPTPAKAGANLGLGRPYFVMELVKGVPLTKYCDEHHLTPRQRLELFVPVCQAVQHAHQKGIIHRDLKPSNILVAQYDGRPVPKVIDFGVAKATGQQLTDHTLVTGFGSIVGTLEYMSPEQAEINQLDIDTRSDIYSLGVVLYELLTGSTPLDRNRLKQAAFTEMLRIIREEEPPKPSTRLSDSTDSLPSISAQRHTEPAKLTRLVRGELDWIVMKALEKDRGRRYETANGFAMDVQRYLADEQVLACPASTAYRLKKFMRRNKGPLLAASLVLLALLAGIIGTTVGLLHAQEARKQEAHRAEGERVAKERAEANFELAEEAVDKFLGTVTNSPELKRADFHRLRKTLLESAIPFHQKLIDQKNDDPKVEAGRGRAYHRLGSVRRHMGETEAAVQDLEAARAIFDSLAADAPAVSTYRRRLAITLTSLAAALEQLGRRRESEVAVRRAQDTWAKLAADYPDVPEYRKNLANSHDNLGLLLFDLGQWEEAESLHRQAIAIVETFVTDVDAPRADRHDLARSLHKLGTVLDDLGRPGDAKVALRRAMDLRTKLAAEFPDEPGYQHDLACTNNNLALVLGPGKEAEALLRRAVAIGEKLAVDFSTMPEYRHDLAQHLHSLGHRLDRVPGKRGEAEATYRRALAVMDKLTVEYPLVPSYARTLAACHNNLALVLKKQKNRAEAKASFRRVVAIMEKLVADYPGVPAHAVDLAGACCNYGNLIRGEGEVEASIGWYEKGIAAIGPVMAKGPRLATAQKFLCMAHQARAEALDELGRPTEAARDWEQAAELDDGPMKAAYRLRMFRNRKDAAGCLAAVVEHEARKLTDAGEMYDAACNRAVCAAVILEDPKTPPADAKRLANEQAELAMAWLRKAVAAGYDDGQHMTRDKDLDALREREDFKKLVAELRAKEK